MADGSRTVERREWIGGAILGVALGGFMDGIMLHQVLQWHHLLSLVEGEALRDIRTQILADGLFHVLMYVVAALGLWLLWSARASNRSGRADRILLASILLGFGFWQFADVVLFHWVVRIHRIRVDVPDPLTWDIGWLVVFGVPALAIGFWLLVRGRNEPPPDRSSTIVREAVTASVLIACLVTVFPPRGGATLVMFRSDFTAAEAFSAVAASDGRIAWTHESGQVVAVAPGPGFSSIQLYRAGAIFIGGAAIAGCNALVKGGA